MNLILTLVLTTTLVCAHAVVSDLSTTVGQSSPDTSALGSCSFDAECNRNNSEDLFFCVPPFSDGFCLPKRNEGDLCSRDSQCRNLHSEYVDPLVCNVPSGLIGRCVRRSRLLSRLAAPCDPDDDLCDSRRSLICTPSNGAHVCQHRIPRYDHHPQNNCEPDSRFSHCSPGDEERECRRERFVPGQRFPRPPDTVLRCRRQTEIVGRGRLCLAEYAACESGTDCRLVPGVMPRPPSPFQRYPSLRVSYCVRVVQEGMSCGNVKAKFTTQCDFGLVCKRTTCVKAAENRPFDEKVTHAGIGTPCSKLPCAPGLICPKGDADTRRCVLPQRVVGKGQTCTDQAFERQRCVGGFVCALGRDGEDVRRCRQPRQEGDYCQRDSDCAKGLSCPYVWTGNREQEERRCYNAHTALRLGQSCDPKASGAQPRCVTTQVPSGGSSGDTFSRPMRCLKKGDGFACRMVAQLFDSCSEAGDTICDTGLKCGNLGICVSATEM